MEIFLTFFRRQSSCPPGLLQPTSPSPGHDMCLHPADVQDVTGYTQGVGLAAAGSARGPRPCLLSWSLLSCLHWAEPGWAQSVCSGSSGYNTTQLDSENTEEGLLCRACCHYRPPPVSGSCYLTTLDTRSRPRSLSSGPRRQRPS